MDLKKALISKPEKLSHALHNGGYCPGDFLEELPIFTDCKNKQINSDICLECWKKHLEAVK